MTILAWLLAITVTTPLFVVLLEIVAGHARASVARGPEVVPPFVVLMPAHDEAAGVAAIIAAVQEQLRPVDRLLVVADNCTDRTAAIASAAGASVCVRTDPSRIGKAYALDFGRDVLRAAPAPIVIVLDADCIPDPGALPRLAARAYLEQAAVQGEYLLTVAADAGAIVRVSAFAFLIRNRLRQRGLQRLSGASLLHGTGMALPWTLFDEAPLATASLVEDLQLGLDLLLSGRAVLSDDRATFRSASGSQVATASQRTRWEHGMVATAIRYVPRLVAMGFARRPALLIVAADLMVPPLAMLAATAGVVTVALMLLIVVGASAMPLAVTGAAIVSVAAAILSAWAREGRAILPVAMLPAAARYLAWKMPIYGALLTNRQRLWVRTSRVP